MTIHARFLPKYPKRINVTDGLTKTEANGVVTLGFDYVNSEFGVELQQTLDSVIAHDASAATHDTNAAASATASAASATASAASAAEAAVFATRVGVIANLTALKALTPYTDAVIYMQGRTSNGDGGDGIFNWRTGDFSANVTADALGAIYVKADSVAATTGAWVRQGGWAIAGVDFRWLGGVMDSTTAAETNCTALQQASNNGQRVNIPAGTLYLALVHSITLEAGATVCAVEAKSGFRLHGQGRDLSYIKLRDNESTDASPLFWNLIACNTHLYGFYAGGITFDLNGQNNLISPNRDRSSACTVFDGTPGIIQWVGHGLTTNDPVRFDTTGSLPSPVTEFSTYYVKTVFDADNFTISTTAGGAALNITPGQSGTQTITKIGSYNPYNTAAVMVSGSTLTVGQDAYVTNFRFLNCSVLNGPGVTSIALAQSEQAGTTLGDDAEIASCYFYNNGMDSNDHSSVFGRCKNLRIHDNHFEFPTASSGRAGPIAAAELHCSENYFQRNTVINYLQGLWLTVNFTETAKGQWVNDNTITCTKKGVAVFIGYPADYTPDFGIDGIDISGNRIHILGDHKDGAKTAIEMTPFWGRVKNVNISKNILTTVDTYACYGVTIGVFDSAGTVSNVTASGNTVDGFANGIGVGEVLGGLVGVADNVKVHGNQIVNIKPSITVPVTTLGIAVSGTQGSISVEDNTIRGISGHTVGYGVFVGQLLTNASALSSLHMDGNSSDGEVTTLIADGANVADRRSGTQALRFSTYPTQSNWRVGDRTYNPTPTLLGTAGSQYYVDGHTRLTSGSAHVEHVDWAERRNSVAT